MTRLGNIIALALGVAAASPLIAREKVAHVYGPAPAWDAYRQIAEADIAARLVDPESARISWLGQYHKGEWKSFLQGRVAGYVACGTVNARNRMGGYAGAVTFVTVIDYDRVLFAELDSRGGGLIAESCDKALRAGMLPPLPTAARASPPLADGTTTMTPATSATGLTLRAMREGAYIAAVRPGSPAAAAALTPGMVIATVNAIPLAGMGDAMLQVVGAAGNNASLGMVGGRTVTLGAKP